MCALIVAHVQEIAFRSVQRPSNLVRWFRERSGAPVSPKGNPIRDSPTFAVGHVGRLASYIMPRPAGPPRAWRFEVLGWVPNRGIGSSAELLPGGSRRGCVSGLGGDAGA